MTVASYKSFLKVTTNSHMSCKLPADTIQSPSNSLLVLKSLVINYVKKSIRTVLAVKKTTTQKIIQYYYTYNNT